MTMIRGIGKLVRNAHGATAVEYGLILALVVLTIMVSLLAFASAAHDIWDNVAIKVTTAGS